MGDAEELRELESLGEPTPREAPRREGGSGLLLFQAGVCVALLLALVGLKLAQPDLYGQVARWVREETAREIALPALPWAGEETAPPAEPTALPTAVPSPTPGPDLGALQEV